MRALLRGGLAVLWLSPQWVMGNPVAASGSAPDGVLLPLGGIPERVCWFEDHKYSQGARVRQGEVWLECAPLHPQEINGALVWRSLFKPDRDAMAPHQSEVTIQVE